MVVRAALLSLSLVGCYAVSTPEPEPAVDAPAAGGAPGASDAGAGAEECKPGTWSSCACTQGGAGRRQCVADGASPFGAWLTECVECRPVIGQLCERAGGEDGMPRIDQAAADECARRVVNALSACVVAADGSPSCVLLECFAGFRDCNADPTDGCECAGGDSEVSARSPRP